MELEEKDCNFKIIFFHLLYSKSFTVLTAVHFGQRLILKYILSHIYFYSSRKKEGKLIVMTGASLLILVQIHYHAVEDHVVQPCKGSDFQKP